MVARRSCQIDLHHWHITSRTVLDTSNDQSSIPRPFFRYHEPSLGVTVVGEPRYFDPIADAKYIQLTTYRRDGRSVATTVHVVVSGDEAFFRTWDVSGKAKRIRHTSRVTVVSSSARGRPYGAAILARAMLLEGLESERVAALLAKKHPVLHGWLIPRVHRLRGWKTQQYRLSPPSDT